MNVKQATIVIILISLLNSGCHCASHIRLTYHTDQPVMLGKAQKIGGAQMKDNLKIRVFDISHYNGEWILFDGPEYNAHDSVDADGELKKIAAGALDNLIKVDTVYFGSVSILFWPILPIFNSYHSTTGIQGTVYISTQ